MGQVVAAGQESEGRGGAGGLSLKGLAAFSSSGNGRSRQF